MSVDKIIQEFELRTQEADKNLAGILGRLNQLEGEFAQLKKDGVKAFKAQQKPVNDLGETIKRLGRTIATVFAAREIVQFGKAAINAASDLNEEVSKSEVIFGHAAKQIQTFAEGAEQALGQSKRQAIEAASTFATFGKSAGLAGDDLATFSTDLVTLSSDLASFYNTSPEEAITAIGAALRGESEPIRRYGVLLDEATLRQQALAMGIIQTTKQALTPQQKVLAAQAVIMKQTGDAQGDFARTSDGVANSQRILAAQFENLQAELGQKLLPIFGKTLKAAGDLLGNLDADDILDFAAAASRVGLVLGAWKIGNMVGPLSAFTNGLKGATLSMKGLNTAVKANPLGLLLSVVSLAASYFIDLGDGAEDAAKEISELEQIQNDYNASLEQLNKSQNDQIGNATNLFIALRKTNQGSEDRKRLIDEINDRYGTTLKNLKDEVEFQKQLDIAQDEVIKGIKEKIALQIQEEKYTQVLKARSAAQAELTELERKAEIQSKLRAQGQIDENQQAEQAQTAALNKARQNLAAIDKEIESLDISTKQLIEILGTNGDGDSGTPTVVGAFEALTQKAGELQTAIRNSLASGDIAGASELTRLLDDLQGKIGFLEAQLEGLNRPIETTFAEPKFVDADGNEYDSFDKYLAGSAQKLNQNPPKVDVEVNLTGADGSTITASLEDIIQATGGVREAFQGLNEYLISSGQQGAAFQQALTVFSITLKQAEAIANAIAAATKTGATPFDIIANIGIAVGAVLSTFAQVNSVLNSAQRPQVPQFYEGTAYLKRNGAPAGRDTIPAMLNEGEAVIPTDKNTMYPGLAESWIKGNLDEYIHRNWVAPAMKQLEEKKAEDMADRLAQSIALHSAAKFDDYRLYRTTKEANSLLGQIAQNTKSKPTKKRRYN